MVIVEWWTRWVNTTNIIPSCRRSTTTNCFCFWRPNDTKNQEDGDISRHGLVWFSDNILYAGGESEEPFKMIQNSNRSTTGGNEPQGLDSCGPPPPPPPQEADTHPVLPIQIIVSMIAPFLNDRTTLSHLSIMSKEVHQLCRELIPYPPWPHTRLDLHNRLWSCAFSPDGTLVAVGGTDGQIRIIDRWRGHVHTLQGHLGRVYSITFTPKGDMMMTLSGDGDLRLWNMRQTLEEEMFELKQQLSTHTTHAICLAYDSQSMRLATGGEGDIRLYSIPSAIAVDVFTMEHSRFVVASVAFSPDGTFLAIGTAGRLIYLWDTVHRSSCLQLEESSSVHSLDYSPCGRYIVAGTDHPTIRLWKIANQGYCELVGHQDMIWSVAFSPNGKLVASASDDGTVRVWSVDTQGCIEMFSCNDSAYHVTFSPCGQYLCSTSNDGSIGLRRLLGTSVS